MVLESSPAQAMVIVAQWLDRLPGSPLAQLMGRREPAGSVDGL